jgi:hypothetical protein
MNETFSSLFTLREKNAMHVEITFGDKVDLKVIISGEGPPSASPRFHLQREVQHLLSTVTIDERYCEVLSD